MDEQVKAALRELRSFVFHLAQQAQLEEEYAQKLWDRILSSGSVLRELAYFHDYGTFLDELKIEGYSLSDIVIWQVDHFKAYMDRHDAMNRYRRERLLLNAFETLLDMQENPEPFVKKMQMETGTDQQNP